MVVTPSDSHKGCLRCHFAPQQWWGVGAWGIHFRKAPTSKGQGFVYYSKGWLSGALPGKESCFSSLFRPAGSVPELQGFLLTGLFLWRDIDGTVTPCAPQSMGFEKLALPGHSPFWLISDCFWDVLGSFVSPPRSQRGFGRPKHNKLFPVLFETPNIVYNHVLKKKGLLVY